MSYEADRVRTEHTDAGVPNGTRIASQTRNGRKLRGPALAIAVVLSLLGLGCAPPSPPVGGGGTEIDFGPLTIPLPPIEIRPPATTIPFGLCDVAYQPPGVNIVGATVTIPRIRIDPTQPIITVPNVVVKIPQLRVPLSTVTLSCGLLELPVQVDLIIPSTVSVQAATLNLDARTITLTHPVLTIDGAGLGVPQLGDLVDPAAADRQRAPAHHRDRLLNHRRE